MTAAHAGDTVLSRGPRANPSGLERAVAWSRQWSAEFPFFLANHLPMVLVALHRMGASDERLEAYCRIYHEQHGLVGYRSQEIMYGAIFRITFVFK